jgi:hypothetical protein
MLNKAAELLHAPSRPIKIEGKEEVEHAKGGEEEEPKEMIYGSWRNPKIYQISSFQSRRKGPGRTGQRTTAWPRATESKMVSLTARNWNTRKASRLMGRRFFFRFFAFGF